MLNAMDDKKKNNIVSQKYLYLGALPFYENNFLYSFKGMQNVSDLSSTKMSI